MIKLSFEEIQANYDKLISYIDETGGTEERKANLRKLHEDFAETVMTAPASGSIHFHGCFAGGYAVHVINVIENAKLLYKVWNKQGSKLNYPIEEIIFAAFCHDLGKLGSLEHDYYIQNESEWHREKQGKYYNINGKLFNMEHAHRSIFLLNQYNINYNENEFTAILTHDGLYQPGNEKYLMVYDKNRLPKTNMLYILHQADSMAYRIELEQEDNITFEY